MNKYTAHLDCVRMDGLHLLECNGPNTLADQRVLAERIAALLNADEQHKADEEYKRPYLQQPVTLTCHKCGTVLAGPGVHAMQDAADYHREQLERIATYRKAEPLPNEQEKDAAANMPYMRQCDRCYQTFDTAKGHDCKEKPITDEERKRAKAEGYVCAVVGNPPKWMEEQVAADDGVRYMRKQDAKKAPDLPPLPKDIDYEGAVPTAINALLQEARRLRKERGET